MLRSMAITFRLTNTSPFGAGTSVGVYLSSAISGSGRDPGTAPPAAAITTAVVQPDGSATFTGLSPDTRYVAGANVGGGVWRYVDFATFFKTEYAELSHDPADAGKATDAYTNGALPVIGVDTSDATMRDAASVTLTGQKKRRIPIADKAVYDLREFYVGDAQPAEMSGYVQDGLAKARASGGWLLVPDTDTGWEIANPLILPHNSRMMGPQVLDLFHGITSTTRGPNQYQVPAGEALGRAYFHLANGANCPMVKNDYDNSHGLRGPDYGQGTFQQRSIVAGVSFNANGVNQVGDHDAIYMQDAFSASFPYCKVLNPRGRGFVFTNCNVMSAHGMMAVGSGEQLANGVGDLNAAGATSADRKTILNATGTWAPGDVINGVAGIPGDTYVKTVVGSTLTLSAEATVTAAGVALKRYHYYGTSALALLDSTTDTILTALDVHGFREATVLMDGCYICTVQGHAGSTFADAQAPVGGYNLWMRDTVPGSPNHQGCRANSVKLRVDHATGHNARLDLETRNNLVEIYGMSPGMYGFPAADGGWVTVMDLGTNNQVSGEGMLGNGNGAQCTALVAYGEGAANGSCAGFNGGDDLAAGTRKYQRRPTSWSSPGAIRTCRTPAPSPFVLAGEDFKAVDGSTAALAVFNSNQRIAMSLPKTAGTESVIKNFLVPNGCNALGFEVLLVNMAGSGSGNVRLQLGFSDVIRGGGNTPGPDEATILQTVAIPASFTTAVMRVGFTEPFFTTFAATIKAGDFAAVKIKRLGADGADTFAGALGLIACLIEPAIVA